MAGIDYYNIREQIKIILESDADLLSLGVKAEIESEIDFGAEDVPVVFIYLERRSPVEQRLAAGERTDYDLQFSLWCGQFSLDGIQRAVELRDELVSKVEVALMRKRTLNGTVDRLRLTGGEFFLARDQSSGFYSLAEVGFLAQAISTTR